jgi:hypothetical protein
MEFSLLPFPNPTNSALGADAHRVVFDNLEDAICVRLSYFDAAAAEGIVQRFSTPEVAGARRLQPIAVSPIQYSAHLGNE